MYHIKSEGGMKMPGRDGTGPLGDGPSGKGGRGGGRGGRFNAGPDGECLCPKCGERIPHQPGTPCTAAKCPKCQNTMIRG